MLWMSRCVVDQKGAVLNVDVWIQSSNINLTDALCEQVKRYVAGALGNYSDRISEAVVYMEAVSELGENLSLACRIDLDLKPSGTLTAQAIDENVDLAISRAAHRIVRRLEAIADRMQPGATRPVVCV